MLLSSQQCACWVRGSSGRIWFFSNYQQNLSCSDERIRRWPTVVSDGFRDIQCFSQLVFVRFHFIAVLPIIFTEVTVLSGRLTIRKQDIRHRSVRNSGLILRLIESKKSQGWHQNLQWIANALSVLSSGKCAVKNEFETLWTDPHVKISARKRAEISWNISLTSGRKRTF